MIIRLTGLNYWAVKYHVARYRLYLHGYASIAWLVCTEHVHLLKFELQAFQTTM